MGNIVGPAAWRRVNWTPDQEQAADRLIREQAPCHALGCEAFYTRRAVRSNYYCAFMGLFIGVPLFLVQLVVFSTIDMDISRGTVFITLMISVGSLTVLLVTYCTCGWKYVWDRYPPTEVQEEAQRRGGVTMTVTSNTPGGQGIQPLPPNPLPSISQGAQPPPVYPQQPPSYNAQPPAYGAPPPYDINQEYTYGPAPDPSTNDPNVATFNFAAPRANYGAPYPPAQPYQGTSALNNIEQQPKRKNFVSDVFSGFRKGKK